MTPPCPDLGDDIPIWGLEPNGSYSVKTGYLLAKEFVERETNGTWKKIWSWEGTTTQIYWKPAQEPGFTLNTDGSVQVSAQRAAAGGCLRNSEGRVVDAFAANLGNCSITRAELTGVVIGLERAWDIGIRQIEVQTDSAVVVKLVSKDGLGEHQHATLIRRFMNLIRRNWQVSVKFIYWEANHLADSLANKGHDLDLGIHSIDSSESNVLYWAKYDLVGGSESLTIFD
ncbi:Putative ribonuclease H protein At1g65750 [Linum perenne]